MKKVSESVNALNSFGVPNQQTHTPSSSLPMDRLVLAAHFSQAGSWCVLGWWEMVGQVMWPRRSSMLSWLAAFPSTGDLGARVCWRKKGGTSVDFLVLGLYWISSTRTLSSLPTRFRLCLWQMVEVDQQTFWWRWDLGSLRELLEL